MFAYVYLCAMICVWTSKATLKLVLSFHNVRPEDLTQVDRFDHKELKLLIHFTHYWFQLL